MVVSVTTFEKPGAWTDLRIRRSSNDIPDNGYQAIVARAKARQFLLCRCGRVFTQNKGHFFCWKGEGVPQFKSTDRFRGARAFRSYDDDQWRAREHIVLLILESDFDDEIAMTEPELIEAGGPSLAAEGSVGEEEIRRPVPVCGARTDLRIKV